MNLYPNCVIRWTSTNKEERILCEHPSGEAFYCILTQRSNAWPVLKRREELEKCLEERQCVVVKDEVALNLRREDALTEAQRQGRERAWESIKDLMNDPTRRIYECRTRARELKLAAEKHNASVKSLIRYLRRYWQQGQTIDALQPKFDKCGGPNRERQEGTAKLGTVNADGEHVGIRVTQTVQEHFEQAIKKYVVGGSRNVVPFTIAFERMLDEHYAVGYEIKNGAAAPVLALPDKRPTFAQFRYYYDKKYGRLAGLKAKLAGPHYQQNCREIATVRTQSALGIGDVYEIDATTADAYLVTSKIDDPDKRNNVVGRAVVYLAIDVFSELVAGLHVTFFSASYNAASVAIWNAFTDKTEYCKSIGITLDDPRHWPSKGLPHSYRADRGELASRKSDVIGKNLGVVVETAQAYSPRAKALVERHFRLRNDRFIRWLPGAVPDEELVKGRADYRKEAALTIEEFTEALVRAVLEHNICMLPDYKRSPAMIRDSVETRPYKIWEWGLAHANKLREMDPTLVRLSLLPTETATVTERGIRLNGLHYTCAKARLEEWFTHANAYDETWEILVSFDPGSVDYVYLLGKSVADTGVCELQECDGQFAGWTWAESDHYQQLKRKMIREGRREDEAAKVATGAQIHDIAKKAIKRRKANGPADINHMTEMQDEHQTEEAQKRAKELHGMLGLQSPKQNPTGCEPPVPTPMEPKGVAGRWTKVWEQKKKAKEANEQPVEPTATA